MILSLLLDIRIIRLRLRATLENRSETSG